MHRQKIIIAVGLIAAIAATFFMLKFNNMLEKRVPVVVVAKSVMPLDVLSSQTNIRIDKIPPQYVLANAVTSLEQVEGKKAKMRLYRDEQIILDKLNPDKIAPLPGEKYLQLPLKGITIKPGEKVDVWVEYIPGKSQFTGAEKILDNKTVATSLDGQGKHLFNPATGATNAGVSAQASIEIIVSDADIKKFIERSQAANQIIVRNSNNSNEANNVTFNETTLQDTEDTPNMETQTEEVNMTDRTDEIVPEAEAKGGEEG